MNSNKNRDYKNRIMSRTINKAKKKVKSTKKTVFAIESFVNFMQKKNRINEGSVHQSQLQCFCLPLLSLCSSSIFNSQLFNS